jgi:cell division protein FtsA
VRALHERIDKVTTGGGDEIVARIPLRYRIDDRQYVRNPVGTFGQRLSATYLLVLTSKQQIESIKMAMHRADITLSGLCITPTTLPDVVLEEVEKEEGVAIVDLGADLTDIVVVREGRMCHFVSLPIGASSIDNDLREFVCAPKDKVEALKKRCLSVISEEVPEDLTAPVQMAGRAKKQILQRNIAEIIEERLKDIASVIAKALKDAKLSAKIPCGVVLTGASAYLSDIDRLLARELGMEVRLADNIHGIDEESKGMVAAYSSAANIGILLYGAQHTACMTTERFSVGVKTPTTPKQPTGELNLTNTEKAPVNVAPTPQPVPQSTPRPAPTPAPTPTPQPVEQEFEQRVEEVEDVEKREEREEENPIDPIEQEGEQTPFESQQQPKKKNRIFGWIKNINSTVNTILNGNEEI